MYYKTLLLFCIAQIIKYSYEQPDQHFYQHDYTYLEATKSFYKVYTLPRTWLEAKRTCASEGARLFFPDSRNERDVVLSYLKETHNLGVMHVGLSDLVAEGTFETIDGKGLNDLPYIWRVGEPNNADNEEDCVEMVIDGGLNDIPCNKNSRPFVCKRARAPCNMKFLDYRYNETLGRCYKFHTNPVSWTDALALCAAELSYLAVINSQPEADYLVELTEQFHRNKPGDYERGTVSLGFYNKSEKGWTTVKGTSVEDSGYASWAPGQPNNSGGSDKCGSMFYNGRLNDIACDKKSFFICEHEIATLTTSKTSLLLH